MIHVEILIITVFLIIFVVKINIFNFIPSKIKCRWIDKNSKCSNEFIYDHRKYDVARICNKGFVPECPNECPPETPIQHIPYENGEQSGFVKACASICLTLLEKKQKLKIGIIVSKRDAKDISSGNKISIAQCNVQKSDSHQEISNKMHASIQYCRKYKSVNNSIYEWLNMTTVDIMFNSWRQLENIDRKAPHLRLLNTGNVNHDVHKNPSIIYLSNHGNGWYIKHMHNLFLINPFPLKVFLRSTRPILICLICHIIIRHAIAHSRL